MPPPGHGVAPGLDYEVPESLAGGSHFGAPAIGALGQRERAVSAAREEVKGAIRNYCAARPDGGAGIQFCAASPASR